LRLTWSKGPGRLALRGPPRILERRNVRPYLTTRGENEKTDLDAARDPNTTRPVNYGRSNMLRKQSLRIACTCVVLGAVLMLAATTGSAQHGFHPRWGHQGWCGWKPTWVAGDFHQHTLYTDGRFPFHEVMLKNEQFDLDWWANSEHGGRRKTDGNGKPWLDYNPNPIISATPGDGYMFRWQSLRDFSFPDVMTARGNYKKIILQGVEWNVPGHEHCSVGLLDDQFRRKNPNASAIAEFEYRFDKSDPDTYGGALQGWMNKNTVNNHQKALEALAWLQANHPWDSYAVIAHPERKGPASSGGYDINDFRDFNNVAPTVAFGFESMPGHQPSGGRGGYGSGASGGGTYGGCGVYAAKVGGYWDALLGEGRRFWLFASSDFHNVGGDFWPGEYQKTYTWVADKNSAQAIVNGLRSGNNFIVNGDLINGLDFQAGYKCWSATMGQTLYMRSGGKLTIKVKFKSPKTNNNNDPVQVHHVDLIAGEVTGKIPSTSPRYYVGENPTTRVIATFNTKGATPDKRGWYTFNYKLKNVKKDMYFRLRGTNLAPSTPNETDADGNPLADRLMGANTAAKCWADLWFYSNPIFVRVLGK
jgi:hypothetical protein